MEKKSSTNVAVLMGGMSGEREVSLNTGKQVVDTLEKLPEFAVAAIDLNSDHKWIDELRKGNFAVAFIALHGKYGEDGTVQGLLELLGIPYVGSGVLASALAMDKLKTRVVYESAGLLPPSVQHVIGKTDPAPAEINYPVVVKPNQSGSSLGVTICHDDSQIAKAIEESRIYDDITVIEDCISGRELTCGVLDFKGDTKALPVTEIKPVKGEFYDYTSKYADQGSRHIVPAQISVEQTKSIQDQAVAAHLALGCKDMSRSDFILSDDGKIYILETNTIPGMTPTSLLPEAAQASGIEFSELVKKMLESALSKS